MRRVRTLLSAMVVLAFATVFSSALEHVAAASAAPAAYTSGLQVTSADHREAGTFSRSATVIRFEGAASSPVRATATLRLNNGKTFTATRDLRSGTATWSGTGAALDPDDHLAFVGLTAAFNAKWVAPMKGTQATLPGQRDLVLRLSMLLAEAPIGVEIGTQQVPRPAERRTDKRYLPEGTPQAEACVIDVIATTDARSVERSAAVAACQVADDDGIRYFGSCSTTGRTICHDSASHCFLCQTVTSGPGSSGCMGECGPGCNGLNIYSYDCGDHDKCGRDHGGSLNPWDSECGDEYWEADDDFVWGWPNC